jgi:hypothetical protein
LLRVFGVIPGMDCGKVAKEMLASNGRALLEDTEQHIEGLFVLSLAELFDLGGECNVLQTERSNFFFFSSLEVRKLLVEHLDDIGSLSVDQVHRAGHDVLTVRVDLFPAHLHSISLSTFLEFFKVALLNRFDDAVLVGVNEALVFSSFKDIGESDIAEANCLEVNTENIESVLQTQLLSEGLLGLFVLVQLAA